MLCTEKEQAEKLNFEQIVEDFIVHKAHRMSFTQVNRTRNSLIVYIIINFWSFLVMLLRGRRLYIYN